MHVLDMRGLEYDVISNTQANVYGESPVSELVLALAKENCTVFHMHEHDETLESYYINLVGGGRHE